MSIEDIDKIDSIGLNKETGMVTLAITDYLNWENEYEHLIMLQEKINSYLSFLESGEVYESYPLAKGKKFEIKIFAKYDLSLKAKEFLNFVHAKVVDAGFNLNYEIVEE
jgi:hypothetical protein